MEKVTFIKAEKTAKGKKLALEYIYCKWGNYFKYIVCCSTEVDKFIQENREFGVELLMKINSLYDSEYDNTAIIPFMVNECKDEHLLMGVLNEKEKYFCIRVCYRDGGYQFYICFREEKDEFYKKNNLN